MADTILNMRAFLLTADKGSFSAAARELGVAPSVVTKRVRQLEWALHAPLLNRSTRSVRLTEVGERYLLAIRQMVREYDDIVSGVPRSAQEIEGHIRIQASNTQAMIALLPAVWAFQRKHPRITLDVAMMDRMANPIEEGFDIVFGIAPGSYDGVLEEPLKVVPRVLCAAPDYLARRGAPAHPQQIPDHDCIVYSIVDPAWIFNGPAGPISVGLRPRIVTNSNVVIFNAACAGAGLAILSRLQAAATLESGELVEVLPDFPVSDLWLKAFIPETRSKLARVQALLAEVRAAALAEPLFPYRQ
jgi:DNA-binding transcriptional LysR family regulator